VRDSNGAATTPSVSFAPDESGGLAVGGGLEAQGFVREERGIRFVGEAAD
jgi:hypothetical protein